MSLDFSDDPKSADERSERWKSIGSFMNIDLDSENVTDAFSKDFSFNTQLIDKSWMLGTHETECYSLDFLSLCAGARKGRVAKKSETSFHAGRMIIPEQNFSFVSSLSIPSSLSLSLAPPVECTWQSD